MCQKRRQPTMEGSKGVGEENLEDAHTSTVSLGVMPRRFPDGQTVPMERRVRRRWPQKQAVTFPGKLPSPLWGSTLGL